MAGDFVGFGSRSETRARRIRVSTAPLLACAGVLLFSYLSACSSDSRPVGSLVNGEMTSPPPDAEVSVEEPSQDGGTDEDQNSGRGDADAGATSPNDTTASDEQTQDPEPLDACLDVKAAPEAPLRRLRHVEYNNTLRELGDTSNPADRFPFEFSEPTALTPDEVEQYFRAARDFALRVTSSDETLSAFTGCSPPMNGEEVCQEKFVREFIGRAFRRPTTATDVADFDAVFATGRNLGGNFASGARAVLEVALQSPEFLYRVEFGEPLGDDAANADRVGWARPTPHEMATRLSYFVWGGPPDGELLQAAAEGSLRDPAEVTRQARRLLDDERARATVRRFYFERLRFPPASEFVTLEPEIAELALTETERFIDAVTWEGPGDFDTLLTAPFTFSNERLAEHYGLPGISGAEFTRVDLDPERAAGLLTQGSFLASLSHPTHTSPTRRGLRISSELLCKPAVEAPAEVAGVLPPGSGLTTRERLESATADPTCATCHDLVDPLGFALEHYDVAGRYRETEEGQPIDATGSIELDGKLARFDGAVELAALLANSDEARQCFVENWMTFAHGRPVGEADACSLEQTYTRFIAKGRNVRELLVALTQSDVFLYRPALPEQP